LRQTRALFQLLQATECELNAGACAARISADRLRTADTGTAAWRCVAVRIDGLVRLADSNWAASIDCKISPERISRCVRAWLDALKLIAKSKLAVDTAQAKEFQACAAPGSSSPEEAEEFSVRDTLRTLLVVAWLAGAEDFQSVVDEVQLSAGIR
jgi:hypothetical protein